MCDDSNPLVITEGEAAPVESAKTHAPSGCKNPNCPNRHRCAAVAKLEEDAPAPSDSKE